MGAGLRDTFTPFLCRSTSPENLLWASPVSLALAVSVTFPRRRKQGRYGSGLEQPPEADSGAAGPRSRRESGKNRIETRFPGLRQPEEIVPPPPGRGTPPAGHRLELRRRAEPRGWRWRDGEARRSSFTRLEHENNKIRNQSATFSVSSPATSQRRSGFQWFAKGCSHDFCARKSFSMTIRKAFHDALHNHKTLT